MIKPVDPPDEKRRQDLLDALAILDTEPEQAYDDLCAMASDISGMPMAAITFIDHDRQWSKAHFGMAPVNGPRETSLCGHVVSGREVLQVPDLAADARFEGNPRVSEEGFRFYAGAPLTLATGEVLGAICVMDVAPRQLDETKLRALRTLARAVVNQLELRAHNLRAVERERVVNQVLKQQMGESRARSETFLRLCKELRSPVVNVLSLITAAVEHPGALVDARRAGERLLDRIDVIRKLADLRQQGVTVDRAEFDLDLIITRATAVARPSAREKNLALVVRGGPAGWVLGDGARVSQLLINLVDNAVKFTDRGEVSIEVTRAGDELEIKVIDTGRGIEPERVATLFEPFGAGLGLSVAREITELHGGSISCDTRLGQGSTFRVRLPLPRAAPTNVTPLPGLRVLVVDDVTINQKVMRAILAPHRTEVRMASSGEEALELFRTETFDLVLMDRYMPGMDGLEATRAMRELEQARGTRTPIFGTSAATEAGERQHFLLAGADDTVAKPMAIDDFWAKVNRVRLKPAPAAA